MYLDTSSVAEGNTFVGDVVNDWSDKEIKKVNLYVNESDSNFTPGTVEIKKVNGAWNVNEITWNTQPEMGENVGSFVCTGRDGTIHNVDLTSSLKNMIKNGELNKGLVFTAKEEGTGEGFKGPEVTHLGYMWISVIYDEEYITLRKYDYTNNTEYDFDYCYDENISNLIERPYIPPNLVSIGSALQPFSIYPGDSLDIADTNSFPYSAVVEMTVEKDTNNDGIVDDYGWYGTGYVIGPDTILTAGHCVHSGDTGWVENIKILTQSNDTNYSAQFNVEEIICPSKYIESRSWEYDWAIITVDGNIGADVGWFGFGVSDNLVDKNIIVAGYAGVNGGHLGMLCKKSGTIVDATERKLFYQASTIAGQSGGPVFDANFVAWGVHTHGFDSNQNNSGARITAGLFSYLKMKRQLGVQKYY